jgi:hypothetical protein
MGYISSGGAGLVVVSGAISTVGLVRVGVGAGESVIAGSTGTAVSFGVAVLSSISSVASGPTVRESSPVSAGAQAARIIAIKTRANHCLTLLISFLIV